MCGRRPGVIVGPLRLGDRPGARELTGEVEVTGVEPDEEGPGGAGQPVKVGAAAVTAAADARGAVVAVVEVGAVVVDVTSWAQVPSSVTVADALSVDP